jgi:glycosyltransferase involved in cell wall biosynthesis
MQAQPSKKIVWLSNVYDHHYVTARGEEIAPYLSAPKRRDLFRCAEAATGCAVIVLSWPPKAAARRKGKWLRALQTNFSTHAQFFCANWDAPKIRIPLSWFFYACHVLRHTRRGDLVVMDNYVFVQVVAAWCLKLFRGARVVLDYEDGRHLIDRSWERVLSGLAELLGRPLVRAAFVVHPSLADRLPAGTPNELVPGFVIPSSLPRQARHPDCVRFLYAGSLAPTHGVEVLLDALAHLPGRGWHLHIAGAGPLEAEVRRAVARPEDCERITFHGSLSNLATQELASSCDVGLNCQRTSDPISEVTFPSKIFTYLSAELVIISSRASRVDKVCGSACIYYDGDDPKSLAAAMTETIHNFEGVRKRLELDGIRQRYSIEGTAARLRPLL